MEPILRGRVNETWHCAALPKSWPQTGMYRFATIWIGPHRRTSATCKPLVRQSLRLVGVTGFEPATSWSRTKRSSQAEPHPGVSILATSGEFAYRNGLADWVNAGFCSSL